MFPEDEPAADPTTDTASDSLTGHLLIAMPSPAMGDPRFERSVIYMCAHSEEGAMGLVINKPADGLSFPDLLDQLDIEDRSADLGGVKVHVGGPVETTRGFVLHSLDYEREKATLEVGPDIGLTATLDIVRALAQGEGPSRFLLALGYAGWGPGQIESEIKANGWLTGPGDPDLVFDPSPAVKWRQAMSRLGITPALLSSVQGTA